jgi:hypothetical protein
LPTRDIDETIELGNDLSVENWYIGGWQSVEWLVLTTYRRVIPKSTEGMGSLATFLIPNPLCNPLSRTYLTVQHLTASVGKNYSSYSSYSRVVLSRVE